MIYIYVFLFTVDIAHWLYLMFKFICYLMERRFINYRQLVCTFYKIIISVSLVEELDEYLFRHLPSNHLPEKYGLFNTFTKLKEIPMQSEFKLNVPQCEWLVNCFFNTYICSIVTMFWYF